jgi:hypothetical protein
MQILAVRLMLVTSLPELVSAAHLISSPSKNIPKVLLREFAEGIPVIRASKQPELGIVHNNI